MKLINNIDRQTRDSGIELLKIFAIFVIVINHTVQSLTNEAYNIPNNGFVIDISRATTNIQCILLQIFRHFGVLGNSVFFICSAWFLLKSKNWNKKKWLFMVIEIWVVSIVIFIITYIILHGNISIGIIISSLFPTTFGNNWYMTCYLLFYPIHPILNSIVNMMNQRQLFRSTLVMVFLYVFMNFINCSWFFSSAIILWITIYFAIAYMQKYLMSFVDNIRENIILFIIGVIGFIGIILITDICGLYSQVLSDKVMRWVNNCNPFLLAMSIAMFNIARNIHFDKNGFSSFDVYHNNFFWATVKLSIPGLHNVLNALSCIAVCNYYGLEREQIKDALLKYTGAHRRFEYVGTYRGTNIYDDYGHHPTEIAATANALKQKTYRQSWVVFQPHTYSRTKNLLKDFARALLGFDNIIITDIYAAREDNIYNISAEDLVKEIEKLGRKAIYIPRFDDIVKYIKERAMPNDIVLTLGAGTVTNIGPMLLQQ